MNLLFKEISRNIKNGSCKLANLVRQIESSNALNKKHISQLAKKIYQQYHFSQIDIKISNDKGFYFLNEIIKCGTELETLKLHDANINNTQLKNLTDALLANPVLINLDFPRCAFGSSVAQIFIDLINNNKKISHLNLTCEQIYQAIKDCTITNFNQFVAFVQSSSLLETETYETEEILVKNQIALLAQEFYAQHEIDSINVSVNRENGFQLLDIAVRAYPGINAIMIYDSKINDERLMALTEALKQQEEVVNLQFRNCKFGPKAAEMFTDLLQTSENISNFAAPDVKFTMTEKNQISVDLDANKKIYDLNQDPDFFTYEFQDYKSYVKGNNKVVKAFMKALAHQPDSCVAGIIKSLAYTYSDWYFWINSDIYFEEYLFHAVRPENNSEEGKAKTCTILQNMPNRYISGAVKKIISLGYPNFAFQFFGQLNLKNADFNTLNQISKYLQESRDMISVTSENFIAKLDEISEITHNCLKKHEEYLSKHILNSHEFFKYLECGTIETMTASELNHLVEFFVNKYQPVKIDSMEDRSGKNFCIDQNYLRFIDAMINAGARFEAFSIKEFYTTAANLRALTDILKECPFIKKLHIAHMFVEGSESNDEAIKILAQYIGRNHNLEEVAIINSNRAIKENGASYLGIMLQDNSSIKKLSLNGNGMDQSGINYLSSGLQGHKSLESIDLSSNKINAFACEVLMKALLHNNILSNLNLGGNPIGNNENAMTALANKLANNSSITRLELGGCDLGWYEASIIAQALQGNRKLEYLNISYNAIGEAGAKAIAHFLRHDTVLKTLCISSNSIGHYGAEALMEALGHNISLMEIYCYERGANEDLVFDLLKTTVGQNHKIASLQHNPTYLPDSDKTVKASIERLAKCSKEERQQALEKLDSYTQYCLKNDIDRYIQNYSFGRNMHDLLMQDIDFSKILTPQLHSNVQDYVSGELVSSYVVELELAGIVPGELEYHD
jgi:Ran GTPase-activating protein (RanGAP) involved in mRNA processing and transport